jgi:hypothetical protein
MDNVQDFDSYETNIRTPETIKNTSPKLKKGEFTLGGLKHFSFKQLTMSWKAKSRIKKNLLQH